MKIKRKEIAQRFIVPIEADPVAWPQIYYGEPLTAIYFMTKDNQYGRVTFEELDSIKVSRGEYLPFKDDWQKGQPYSRVTIVNHSKWLKERYDYEAGFYGNSYNFGGNVDEMLTDFKHYIFSFHDQFVEVIARGVWFEEDSEYLFGKELSKDHPFQPIPSKNTTKFEAYGITCQARINPRSEEVLKKDAIYCSQRLIQFALELNGGASVGQTLFLSYRKNKLISRLIGLLGEEIILFNKFATLEDVKPYIEKHMKEVAERRRLMKKKD